MNSTYESTLKDGPKVNMEICYELKVEEKF